MNIFMEMSGELYLLLMVGGLSWMKMADSVEVDQLDFTTSDDVYLLNLLGVMF